MTLFDSFKSALRPFFMITHCTITYFHRADLFGAGKRGLPVDVDGI